MLRVQQGDASAFTELLERNHRRVLGLAYRYLGDRAKAEDIAQETFLNDFSASDNSNFFANTQANGAGVFPPFGESYKMAITNAFLEAEVLHTNAEGAHQRLLDRMWFLCGV